MWERLIGLDVDPGSGVAEWGWRNAAPGWIGLLLLLAILFFVTFVYRRERHDASRAVRAGLTAIRMALIVWILVLLSGPMLTVDAYAARKAVVAVLIDESASMRLEARMDQVKRALKGTRFEEELRLKRLQVRYYAFARSARRIESDQVSDLEPRGAETAVGDAIQQVLAMNQTSRIAALVLISDGQHNWGSDPRGALPRDVYVATVAPGVPQTPRDVQLLFDSATRTGMVHDRLPFRYRIRHQGFDGESAAVEMFAYRLKTETEELLETPDAFEERIGRARREAARSYALQGEIRGGSVWTPTEPGLFEIILKIRPRDGEITAWNNYLSCRVRVIERIVKVLFVDHLPRWDTRFLQNALIRDPSILCHCLLTSGDRDFPQPHSRPEGRPKEHRERFAQFFLPLTEFPRTLKQMLEYDVIILGDVHPDRLGALETQLDLVRFGSEFGGGILFIAGTRFNPRTMFESPIGKMLPVVRPSSGVALDHPAGFALTDEGRTHAATQFEADPEANRKIWEAGVPGIRWVATVRELKPAATPLVLLSDVADGGKKIPVVVSAPYGRGRVLMSLTDETWRWRMMRGDSPFFYPFWRQAIFWSCQLRINSTSRYVIEVERDRYAPKETVRIFARKFDSDMMPVGDPRLEARLIPPEGNVLPVTLRNDGDRFAGQFKPTLQGRYLVKVGDPFDENDQAAAVFEVVHENREEIAPEVNVKALRAWGDYHELPELASIPAKIPFAELRFSETIEDDVGDSPLAFLVFALLITLEWIVRKVYRML